MKKKKERTEHHLILQKYKYRKLNDGNEKRKKQKQKTIK